MIGLSVAEHPGSAHHAGRSNYISGRYQASVVAKGVIKFKRGISLNRHRFQ